MIGVSFSGFSCITNVSQNHSRCFSPKNSIRPFRNTKASTEFLLAKMDVVSQDRRPPAPLSQSQALPSIASLTGTLAHPEQSPVRLRQPSEARDSGNWSISQSKRKPAPLPLSDLSSSPPILSLIFTAIC